MLPLQGFGMGRGHHFCTLSLKGARIAPAGPRLGGQKGVFSGRGGGGREKSFRGAPGGYRADS